MRTAPPAGLPDTRTGPEALIKEAPRRQRRRWLAVAVAVAAVLAGVAGGVAGHQTGRPGPQGHPGPPPAPIPHSIGTTVLMWPAGSGVCCGPVAIDT